MRHPFPHRSKYRSKSKAGRNRDLTLKYLPNFMDGTFRTLGMAMAMTCALSACAHYTPLDLPTQPKLAASPQALVAAPAASPLTVEQVVTLVLANNPDLQAARLKRGIAAGQITQASALANPSLSAGLLPLLSGAGTVPAWNLGLAQDIKSIITYKSRRRAAQDSAGQVEADIRLAGMATRRAGKTDRDRPDRGCAHALQLRCGLFASGPA